MFWDMRGRYVALDGGVEVLHCTLQASLSNDLLVLILYISSEWKATNCATRSQYVLSPGMARTLATSEITVTLTSALTVAHRPP